MNTLRMQSYCATPCHAISYTIKANRIDPDNQILDSRIYLTKYLLTGILRSCPQDARSDKAHRHSSPDVWVTAHTQAWQLEPAPDVAHNIIHLSPLSFWLSSLVQDDGTLLFRKLGASANCNPRPPVLNALSLVLNNTRHASRFRLPCPRPRSCPGLRRRRWRSYLLSRSLSLLPQRRAP